MWEELGLIWSEIGEVEGDGSTGEDKHGLAAAPAARTRLRPASLDLNSPVSAFKVGFPM